ncbi:MAG: Uma2 family endonuclease, partial [Nodosilinea sp.]
LSPGTEREDLGRFFRPGDALSTVQPLPTPTSSPGKLEVYERYLQVPHYIVYSRYSQTLRYFKLVAGRYQEHPLAPQPPLIWLPELHLGLGIWSGEFQRTPGQWLRWCDQAGDWVLTETEQERQRANRLAAKLRELGIDPEQGS